MKMLFFALSFLPISALAMNKCDNPKNEKLAICKEILQSEIDGRPQDKISSGEITLSKITGSPLTICKRGELKTINGEVIGFHGSPDEDGKKNKIYSVSTVDTETETKVHYSFSSKQKSPSRRGPNAYDSILLNKQKMELTWKASLGLKGFVTVRFRCRKSQEL